MTFRILMVLLHLYWFLKSLMSCQFAVRYLLDELGCGWEWLSMKFPVWGVRFHLGIGIPNPVLVDFLSLVCKVVLSLLLVR